MRLIPRARVGLTPFPSLRGSGSRVLHFRFFSPFKKRRGLSDPLFVSGGVVAEDTRTYRGVESRSSSGHDVCMREILPGLFHWTAIHPKIKIEVSSYYVLEHGVLLDPLVPPEGFDWFRARRTPELVILTNRHHFRHCAEFQGAFGCTVWCNAEGMNEFQAGEKVEPFAVGHVFPGGIESHPVGAICSDETALRIPVPEGALAVADGVVRDGVGA